jgi:diguanylate cyclase (GGDEF)-like protein
VFKDTTMRVTASIGSAKCPSQGTATDSLYKSADLALYEAKRSGRNTWRWWGQPHAREQSPAAAEKWD